MDFSFGFGLGSSAYLLSGYNPLINYDWSTTTTSGLRYLKDVGSTPTYNASMYFGRGAYLNGVDQTITVPINTTIQTALKRVNGVVTINETSQTLTNYVISGLGVHKDYYLFTRLLTTAEKDSYTNTPELFYAMAQTDSNCVLNMPMCETSSTARNYKTGIDYPITNYTSSVRDNAKNLQYGLQTCKFVRDSLGVIQSASDYLVGDGGGYADTSYVSPLEVVPESFEIIIEKPKIVQSSYNKYICGGGNSSDMMIEISSGSDTDGYVRFRKVGQSFSTSQWLPSNLMYITLTCNGTYVKVYFNGIFSTVFTALPYTVSNSVKLMTEYINNNSVLGYRSMEQGAIRLFKVHNKELTQAEITANFNSYRAKGLLS